MSPILWLLAAAVATALVVWAYGAREERVAGRRGPAALRLVEVTADNPIATDPQLDVHRPAAHVCAAEPQELGFRERIENRLPVHGSHGPAVRRG